jgi:hypothetical protein
MPPLRPKMLSRKGGVKERSNRGRRRKGRGYRDLLYALFFAFIVSTCINSCGLEDVSYYSQPSFTYGGNIITLVHNTSNITNFDGYDIYYRAYQLQDAAETARQSIESAASSTSSTAESVIAQLTTQKFKKMYLYNPETKISTETTPLLTVANSSSSVSFTIQPSNSSSEYWYYKNSSDATAKKYYVARGTGSGESFSAAYNAGDSDYSNTTGAITSGKTVYLVFFAVAYGFDMGNLVTIYGMPTSLSQPVEYTLP